MVNRETCRVCIKAGIQFEKRGEGMKTKNVQSAAPEILPVIPTMDVVVFPHAIVPLLVLDNRIITGINQALQGSKTVLLLAAKKQLDDQGAIGTKDLYEVGTVASIMRLIKIPEGGIKILVQGLHKARVKDIAADAEILKATVERFEHDGAVDENELVAQIKNIKKLTERMATSGYSFSPDFHIILSKMQDAEKIADFILSHLNLTVTQAQELLETPSQKEFLGRYLSLLKQRDRSCRNSRKDTE